MRGVVLMLLVVLTACDLPKDAVGTLEQARGDTLRVGVVASPPYLVRTGGVASGPEAELVRAFAASIDGEVEWRWGSLDAHMKALEAFELDLVAAGLTTMSPWKKTVGFTRPWWVDGPPPPGLDQGLERHQQPVLPGRHGQHVLPLPPWAARRR